MRRSVSANKDFAASGSSVARGASAIGRSFGTIGTGAALATRGVSAAGRGIATTARVATAALAPVAVATTAVVAGTAAIGVSSIKAAANYDQSFSGVSALLQQPKSDLGELDELITSLSVNPNLKIGFQDAFLATESLIRNGAQYDDILGGVLENTILFQNATGTGFDTAAVNIQKFSKAFGLAPGESGGLANALTGTTLNSSLDANDLRLLLSQGSAVANQGIDLDEFLTGATLVDEAFASGSDIGTAFRNFISNLGAPTDIAAAAMEELGLQAFTAQGELRTFPELITEINNAFGDLSEEERLRRGKDIFGADGTRFALALLGDSAEDFAKQQELIFGTDAVKIAALQTDNLADSWDTLGDTVEATKKVFGDAFLESVQASALGLADALSAASPAFTRLGVVAAGALQPALDGLNNFADEFGRVAAETGSIRLAFDGAFDKIGLEDLIELDGDATTINVGDFVSFTTSPTKKEFSLFDFVTISSSTGPGGAGEFAFDIGDFISFTNSAVATTFNVGDFISIASGDGFVNAEIGPLSYTGTPERTQFSIGDFVNIDTGGEGLSGNIGAFEIDTTANVTSVTQGDFTLEYDATSTVASVEWGDFTFDYDTTSKVGSVAWGDFTFDYNAAAGIANVEWGDFTFGYNADAGIVGVEWGDYTNVYDADAGVSVVQWGSYTNIYDATAGIRTVEWGNFSFVYAAGAGITDLNWGDFTFDYDATSGIKSVDWGSYTNTYDTKAGTSEVAWGDFSTTYDVDSGVTAVNWGDFTFEYNVKARVTQVVDAVGNAFNSVGEFLGFGGQEAEPVDVPITGTRRSTATPRLDALRSTPERTEIQQQADEIIGQFNQATGREAIEAMPIVVPVEFDLNSDGVLSNLEQLQSGFSLGENIVLEGAPAPTAAASATPRLDRLRNLEAPAASEQPVTLVPEPLELSVIEQPVSPILDAIEPEAVAQPLFPVLDAIEPQAGVANMSIGEVEAIDTQEATANITWEIPPIPEQEVTVRVNRVDAGGGSSSAAIPPNIPENASGTNFFPGGLTRVSEGDRNELIIEPGSTGRRYVAIGEQVLNLPRGTKIIDAPTTRRLLGIADQENAATQAFADELIRRDQDELEQEEEIRRIASPSSFGGFTPAPASAFAGFFREGGDYSGVGFGVAGEAGRELFERRDGSMRMLGAAGPEMLVDGPGRVFDHGATERLMGDPLQLPLGGGGLPARGERGRLSRVERMMMSPPVVHHHYYGNGGGGQTHQDNSQDNSKQIVLTDGGSLISVQTAQYNGLDVRRGLNMIMRGL